MAIVMIKIMIAFMVLINCFLYYYYYSVSANLVPVVRQAEPFAGQPISSSLRAS